MRCFLALSMILCHQTCPGAEGDATSVNTDEPEQIAELEAQKATLAMLSQQMRGNYERIRTWTGRFSYDEHFLVGQGWLDHAYRNDEELTSIELPVRVSQSASGHFAVDQSQNKLITATDAVIQPEVVEVSTGRKLPNSDLVSRTQVNLVTPKSFIHFDPARRMSSVRDHPQALKGASKDTRVAFRDTPELAHGEAWGSIIDPRALFSKPSRPFWDEFQLHVRSLEREPTKTQQALEVRRVGSDEHPQFDIIVKYGNATKRVQSVTIDSACGFNPVLWQQRRADDGVVENEIRWTWTLVAGVHVFDTVTYTKYSDDGKERRFERRITLTDQEVNVPSSKGPNELGELGLKDGDRIVDRTAGTVGVLVNDKIVPLREGAEARASDGLSGRTVVLLINLVVLVIAGIIFGAFHWRRKITQAHGSRS